MEEMVFRRYKTNNKKWSMRILFHTNYRTNKKKFEAMFINILGYTFWLWRTKQIYYDWPNAA